MDLYKLSQLPLWINSIDVIPSSILLLKRLPSEVVQLLPYRRVQFRQGEELLIPEYGKDPGGDNTYSTLGIGLILGGADSGRDDGTIVMFRHLVVDRIDLWIIPDSIPDYGCLAIIRDEDFGYTAKVFKHMNVGGDPRGVNANIKVHGILFFGVDTYPRCPRCKLTMDREYVRFCDRCGQKLDWSSFEQADVINLE